MSAPTPFTIVRNEGQPVVASNGALRLACLEPDGEVKLRRGIRGALGGPLAERMLPQLNALASDLLTRQDMPPEELAARLHVLQLACQPKPVEHIEWAFVKLDGVYVFTDGQSVIVTRQDMQV